MCINFYNKPQRKTCQGINVSPIPAAAKYKATGHPSPPAPTISTELLHSLSWPTKSKQQFNVANAPVIWNPRTPHPGHCWDVHSVWVWKPVKFPDTGAKVLSEVHIPGYSAVQTKVPCALDGNNLCQMFKLPSGMKMRPLTNQMWIPCSSPDLLHGKEVKVSVHQGNTSWWIWDDYLHFAPAIPRMGVGVGGSNDWCIIWS